MTAIGVLVARVVDGKTNKSARTVRTPDTSRRDTRDEQAAGRISPAAPASVPLARQYALLRRLGQ
eukprot:7295937-Prymnesium_polylepis.1